MSRNDDTHRMLARAHALRLRPGFPDSEWRGALLAEVEVRLVEGAFVEAEREAVSAQAAAAPSEARAFVDWFEGLAQTGPGQGDPLFPWLAESASLAQMHWFLQQEIAGEAGFDDLVALTQVRMPVRPKLELARNYWDEMGRGTEHGMHGPMLAELGRVLDITAPIDDTVWESLALANLLVALASSRRYAFHSVGALGVIEMTAPDRVAQVDRGLQRLGIDRESRRYFTLHAALDRKHSEAWNREVLWPLVDKDPRCARAIAEGALLRLRAGARCYARYREHFGLSESPLHTPHATSP